MGEFELQNEQLKLQGEGQGENRSSSKRKKKKIVGNLIEADNHNINYENLTWEFDNVLELTRYGEKSKYVAVIDLYTLGECYKNNLLYYKSSIQRGSKLDKNNNEVPIFKISKVKDIINAVLSDNWHGGALIVNADVNINELEYDPDTKSLKGHGKMFIVDGNHRLISAKRLYDLYNKGKIVQNPRDYQIVCIIDATNDTGAAKIFSELNLLPWKVPKSRSGFLQVDKLENIVARNIMKNSELSGRVETISTQPKGNNVITFNTLISGIEHIKGLETKEQAEVLSKNLVEYVNIIVNIFPKILGSVSKETREENRKLIYAGEPMFLEAFFAAFQVLVGKDDMVERLKSLRRVIKIGDWQGEILSRDNKIWLNNITINGKIVNKRGTKKFVRDTIKEYLESGKLPMEYEVVE